ncbi:MAG: hypothetical protein KC468_34330 [Myxococcales bacterium]|nr:hypothetical protein [Myxococcales bacterium]
MPKFAADELSEETLGDHVDQGVHQREVTNLPRFALEQEVERVAVQDAERPAWIQAQAVMLERHEDSRLREAIERARR